MQQSDRFRRRLPLTLGLLLLTGGVGALVVWSTWLPRAPDLYVHLLWSWQVATCLAHGQLPVWLPDLNAGFGSPGIRLYSPLGPVVSGGLALLLGDAGRGLRAAALVAAAVIVGIGGLREDDSHGRYGRWTGVLVLTSPMVLFSLVGRAAWSEFLAIPLLWWTIERLLDGRIRTGRDGAVIGGLWLCHVPSALMAGCLGAASLGVHRSRHHAALLLRAAAVAAGLTAWHWLPLLQESAGTASGQALTSGIFEPSRNLLGSSSAHALAHNIWLGWVAVALLAALLAAGIWRTEPARAVLAVGCVLLASPVASPLWQVRTPLQLLQFPWRWLLPATLLLVPALVTARRLRALAVLCVLAPLPAMGWTSWASVPKIDAAMGWRPVGSALYEALGANPYLVDAAQNRPPAFAELGRNLGLFGDDRLAVASGGGRVVAVPRWSPLRREVEVAGADSFIVGFRILDYPYWSIRLDDGTEPERGGMRGVLSCALPPGRHTIRVSWTGNPLAAVGQLVAGATLLSLLVTWRRRRGDSS